MKKQVRERIVLVGTVLIGLGCWTAPATAETARVLPAGRSRFSFIYGQTDQINQQFDASGNKEMITQPYNMELSSQLITKIKKEAADLVRQLNATGLKYDATKRTDSYNGVSKSETGVALGTAVDRGHLNVDAYANRQQSDISYQHGVTSRLTIGFAVPIINMKVHGNASITGLNSASDIAAYCSKMGIADVKSSLDFIAKANDQTLHDLLKSRDYSDATSYNKTALGDLILGGRYNYLATPHDRFIASFQMGAVAPTGALKDPGEPLAQDFGNGAWDLEAANITNYNPTSWLTLSNGLHYGHFLPGHRQMRVNAYADEFLPNAADQENVGMQLGDKYSTNFALDFKPTRAFTFTTSYEWSWKAKDHFQGARDRDYTYLSDNSNSYTEMVQVGVSLTTIPSFLKSEFPAPIDVALNVYIPTEGKNTPVVPYGTAEVALYF